MTGRFYYFTDTIALITVLLELLNKSWSDLLFLNCEALTITFRTCVHILRSVSARASAMRADNFAVICDFMLFAQVKLLESDADF